MTLSHEEIRELLFQTQALKRSFQINLRLT